MNEAAAIDAVFCPKSIAVVGASADPSKFGSQVLQNLRSSGFPGKLFPISRSPGEVCGLKPFASLRDLSQPVDLVLVSVPVQHAPATIEDAVVASAKAAVVYTAGFQEIGEAGRVVQNDMLSRTGGKLRLVGPNCLGIRNFHLPMNASPVSQNAPAAAGNVAFISQSGAFGSAATVALGSARVGLSKLASIGNMADLTHAHIFRYLKDDPETAVIAAFVEGVPDVAAFLDAIADVTRSKPVVILKGGRSPAGQRAALSHTGSLAGDGRVWDSLLREAGATVAASSEDLFDAAAVFSRHGRQRIGGSQAAIFSLAGGPGVVAADHCDELGITLPALGDKLGALRAIVPPFAALGNPVEVTGQTKREHLDACAKAIVALTEVDAMIGIAIGLDFAEFANALIAANTVKPVVACVVAPQSEALLANGGVANFPSVDRAVRALGHLMTRGAQTPRAVVEACAAVVRPLVPGLLSEVASKSYLAGYGLPVTDEQEVDDGDAAVAAADRLGYPVVLKVSSAAIPHKSDVGGVLLNLGNGEAVRAAGAVLCERFPGIPLLVQKMVAPGLELIVGAKRTNGTGAIVMVGIGGVFAEVLDDVVFCRAPARQENVTAAMERLRSRRLLDGYRGGAAIDRMAVASIAARLSEIVAANPALREIDLNPVIANAAGAIIVDALIRSEGDRDAEADL